jgi:high-affinity iron transporter
MLAAALPAALIVFREVIEAALIVSIVLAATRSLPRSRWFVGFGVAAGAAGSIVIATFGGWLEDYASGDLFNAAIMFVAATMLGWHCVWMSRHGRELANEASAIGRAVSSGNRPLSALSLVVGIAVLREGFEVVLFLFGQAAGQADGAAPVELGFALGLVAGLAVGAAMYGGLLRMSPKHLFSVTNWMITLVAAGMASTGTYYLVQADVLPSLGDAIWDTSDWLPDTSVLGKALHAMVGYTAAPMGIQLVVYGLALTLILGLTRATGRAPARRPA